MSMVAIKALFAGELMGAELCWSKLHCMSLCMHRWKLHGAGVPLTGHRWSENLETTLLPQELKCAKAKNLSAGLQHVGHLSQSCSSLMFQRHLFSTFIVRMYTLNVSST